MSEEPKFKVGDKVAVFARGNFQGFDEVSKVTPTGRIRVKGIPDADYNPNGDLRKAGWGWGDIRIATPELVQEIREEREVGQLRVFVRHFNFRNLDLPQLRRLKALLDEFEQEAQ